MFQFSFSYQFYFVFFQPFLSLFSFSFFLDAAALVLVPKSSFQFIFHDVFQILQPQFLDRQPFIQVSVFCIRISSYFSLCMEQGNPQCDISGLYTHTHTCICRHEFVCTCMHACLDSSTGAILMSNSLTLKLN